MLNTVLVLITLITTLLSGGISPVDTKEKDPTKPQVILTLSKVTAKTYQSGDLLFSCEVTLDNRTGKLLKTRSRFSSIFDGLTIVITNSKGEELVKQPFIYHKSPSMVFRDYIVKQGKTTEVLTFPISREHSIGCEVKVQLIGNLPGSTYTAGFSTKAVDVAIPAVPTKPKD